METVNYKVGAERGRAPSYALKRAGAGDGVRGVGEVGGAALCMSAARRKKVAPALESR